MFEWILRIPAIISAIVAILKALPVLMEALSSLAGNARKVKEQIPHQKVSLVNLVQASMNNAVDTNKVMLPGAVPMSQATPTDTPKRVDVVADEDPRLKKIIEDNTVKDLVKHEAPRPGQQAHHSMSGDGTSVDC